MRVRRGGTPPGSRWAQVAHSLELGSTELRVVCTDTMYQVADHVPAAALTSGCVAPADHRLGLMAE